MSILEASREGDDTLKRKPETLDIESELKKGNLSLKSFHNILYDGFYAPYLRNPKYLLLIDARQEQDYNANHVITARWHGRINRDDTDYTTYCQVVIYDDNGNGINTPDSSVKKVIENFTRKQFSPMYVKGGYSAIEKSCKYLLTRLDFPYREHSLTVDWFPSMILEANLYLGRADQAVNATVIKHLGITDVVCVTDRVPTGIFKYIKYKIVPISEFGDSDLLSKLPSILEFISDAIQNKGKVLVHCDQVSLTDRGSNDGQGIEHLVR